MEVRSPAEVPVSPMKNPLRLLVVDDDARFRRITTIALEAAGIEYEEADDGEQGLAALERSPSGRFDAILLDVDMPRIDGWELLLQVREKGNEVPVLFITGRDTTEERVKGLKIGADDYIVKPVEFPELLARIEAVIRRRRSLPTIDYGDLRLDLARRRVERAGQPVELSPREYDLLLVLVEANGDPVSRVDLLRKVWDMDFDPETNVIDVHVGRVRKKLNRQGPSMIETVRGQGYRALRCDPATG